MTDTWWQLLKAESQQHLWHQSHPEESDPDQKPHLRSRDPTWKTQFIAMYGKEAWDEWQKRLERAQPKEIVSSNIEAQRGRRNDAFFNQWTYFQGQPVSREDCSNCGKNVSFIGDAGATANCPNCSPPGEKNTWNVQGGESPPQVKRVRVTSSGN